MPALDGWLVTRRDLCIEVMRDAARFTVDDPRFSTAQVVGPSMLSLDGDEHRRHRDPFARAFLGPDARARFAGQVEARPRTSWWTRWLRPAGPRSAATWPDRSRSTSSSLRSSSRRDAGRDARLVRRDRGGGGPCVGRWRGRSGGSRRPWTALDRHVDATIERGGGVVADATGTLTAREVASNTAVMLFGAIETGEGMTTTLFWHLLLEPGPARGAASRSLARGPTPSRSRSASSRRPPGSTATRRPTPSWPARPSGRATSSSCR